jgi:hypothetical protein
MNFYPQIILTAGDMSTDLVSTSFKLTNYYGASVSCVVTTGPSAAGTLGIEGSIDNINFAPLRKDDGTAITLTVAGNGTYIFDVIQSSVAYLRVIYTTDTNAGSLTCTSYSKGT